MVKKVVINRQDDVIADVVIIGLENTVNVCIVYIKIICFYVFYSMSSDTKFQVSLNTFLPDFVVIFFFWGGGGGLRG